VIKQHSKRLRTQFLELTTSANISSFSTLVGDIILLLEKDIQWLGHVDLVITGYPCQGMSMVDK
jgi:site-specific DNA-cytosine methylase